ncbi:MAG TPA: hypothetical protein DCS66_22955 [Flavobacteriaceae bacterium]|nr:hypothetical protein [Flavobacteriaceae bacterium]
MSENHAHLNEVVQNQSPEGEQLGSSIEYEDQSYEGEGYDYAADDDSADEGSSQDQFASKFAALSRKEKALRERESDYESKFEDMERRLQEYETKDQEPEVDWEHMLRNDPLGALEEAGLGYDKLTELALNDGRLTPDMQMMAMREEIERDYKRQFEELEDRLTAKEEAEQEEYYDHVQENFQDEIKGFVHQNPNDYELISASEGDSLVYDVIEEHYNETGRILDLKDAADAVESYLEEEATKLMRLNKISSKFGINPPELAEMMDSQVTLSNDHAAHVNYEGASKMLSDDESKAKAAAYLQRAWDREGLE